MKKALSVGMVLSLLFMFFLIDVHAQTGAPPPLAQPLVREGEFAVRLAEVLLANKAASEEEAESLLTSVGIAPRNGWIANYPMTPDIIGELRSAVGEAADSGRIPMKREEAEKALDTLSRNVGLPVATQAPEQLAQKEPQPYSQPPSQSEPQAPGEPAPNYGEYSSPDVVNNYYYDEGPPVVTYYPPPWDYYYLYAWVPYPFWWAGFFFPGYYMLCDFSRFILVGNTVVVVSNHYHDHRSRRIHRIDPVTRRTWKDLGWDGDSSHWKRGSSAEAREGASSIYRRSIERRGTFPPSEERERRFGGKDFPPPRPGDRNEKARTGERYERGRPPGTGGNTPAPRERREWPGRPSSGDRWTKRTGPEPGPREREAPSNPPSSRSDRERFAGPPQRYERTPSERGGRSFSGPAHGEARSFRSPSPGGNSSGEMGRGSGAAIRSFHPPSPGGRGSSEGFRGGGRSQGGASGHGSAPKGGICLGGRC